MLKTVDIKPLYIKVHENDNVAIVANDGGLPAGTQFSDGLVLVTNVPQGHKVALHDIARGDPVIRYNVVISYAAEDLPRGTWINERVTTMPAALALDNLPIATRPAPAMPSVETTAKASSMRRAAKGWPPMNAIEPVAPA